MQLEAAFDPATGLWRVTGGQRPVFVHARGESEALILAQRRLEQRHD